jgi:phosphoribosylamine--glycine ligase
MSRSGNRSGDSETETDLVELFLAVANEKLDEITLEIDERSATTVCLYLVATLRF